MKRISYDEAFGPPDGNSILRFLENVAAGRYWHDGRQFDPPTLQAQKAGVILQELTHQIAELPDPDSLPNNHCGKGSRVETQAQIALLRLEAWMKFDEAVRKAPQPEPDKPKIQTPPASAEPENEHILTGDEKLKAAKDSVKGLL
jgi:hypothetical protein